MKAQRPSPARLRTCFLLIAIVTIGLASQVRAATLPTGFREILVASGLTSPTAMQFAPDGRLFVCEQTGSLRVIKNGSLLATPFVTITVNSAGERGLLGVAFDPAFATNSFVYVYYTATSPAIHNRISRFTANGDVAAPNSEVVIFDLDNLSSATNHNGGAIAFGPDGKLYAAVGENANGANAQSFNNVLGKMLRINADGSIPTDNPFLASTTGRNRAIWALGLRNPFTFAFDPMGTELYINDVGQSAWEEIDDGIAGSNYGWPETEGATSDPRFRTPLYSYNHSGGACAITGGAFYAPLTSQFPADYFRDYFFADFCGGWIQKLDPAAGYSVVPFASGISSPVDLKVSDDGALYYLARGGGGSTGVVYRVEYGGAPSITTQPASQTIPAGSPVTFRVRATGAPTLHYQWRRNGTDVPGATAQDYTIPVVAQADNGARFRAFVSNSAGSALSDEAVLTIATPTATATFLRMDGTTQGTWIGAYGTQGAALATETSTLPAYAQLTFTGQSTWTWAASTSDTRALQRPTITDRFAATWYSGGSFTLDLNLTDGAPHQVALYGVDWEGAARSERIDVLDAATSAVLDSRTVSSFVSGQYLSWTIRGHVQFRITLTGGTNAVLSGLFVDPVGGGSSGGSATFLRTDTSTQGTWHGTYGAQGNALAGETSGLPAYANLALGGQSVYTWMDSTSDVRALQRPTGSNRFAATWYSGSFTIDLNLTDGASHQIALYGVDWDAAGRSQRIDVLDAATNNVLDTRTLASFVNGQYLVWRVAGHVIFRVTLATGVNAVLSGLFVDPIGGGSTTVANFVRTDTSTQGTWHGTYGARGDALAGETSSLPSYAQLALGGQSAWTWMDSTSDVRALQRPTSSDRFAATWYGGSFTIDLSLTDGASHQIALYGVDWDARGRIERIDVLDAATGAVLDSRTLASFVNGQYLVWTVTGHVIFRVTLTGGVNAVLSGLFID
jgi:glucose/arabinose dehydrogenase